MSEAWLKRGLPWRDGAEYRRGRGRRAGRLFAPPRAVGDNSRPARTALRPARGLPGGRSPPNGEA
jgi:hypothetical protein